MDIYVCVVVDPHTREDLFQRIFEARSQRRGAIATLRPVDTPDLREDITVEFYTRQIDLPSVGDDTIRGEFVRDGQQYLINFIIPFWGDEEIVAKIASAPPNKSLQKGSGQP